eukprot:2806263-Rhodomonas_salina.2
MSGTEQRYGATRFSFMTRLAAISAPSKSQDRGCLGSHGREAISGTVLSSAPPTAYPVLTSYLLCPPYGIPGTDVVSPHALPTACPVSKLPISKLPIYTLSAPKSIGPERNLASVALLKPEMRFLSFDFAAPVSPYARATACPGASHVSAYAAATACPVGLRLEPYEAPPEHACAVLTSVPSVQAGLQVGLFFEHAGLRFHEAGAHGSLRRILRFAD